MRKQILNSLTTAFFLSLMIFISCGDGGGGDEPPAPTAAEEQFARLAKTWTLSSVSADGTPVEGWEGFTVTFGGTATSGDYSTNGSQPDGTTRVWPASGRWTFASETDVNTIERNDGVSLRIALDTNGTSAVITFSIADDGNRQDIVEGDWNFTMTAP